MKLSGARRALLRNFGAHLGGLYGSKGLELVILLTATRLLSLELVGTVFLAEAIGGMVFRLLDAGLFPVLFRRASRDEAGAANLWQATAFRLAGLAVLTAVFIAIVTTQFPEHAGVATAFFFFNGVYVVHEIPRALLAGRERFVATAATGLVTKAVEVSVTVPGLLLGYGVWAWVLGRALSQLGMLAGVYVIAKRELRAFESTPARSIVREGLPFWFDSAVNSALFRLDTIVVGTYLGLVETAQLGIAARVIGGSLSMIGSLLNVSFPALARTRRRFFSPVQIATVATLSFGLMLVTLVFAPLIVKIITGGPDPAATRVLRALTPVIPLAATVRALLTWLRAHNKERAIAALTAFAATVSASALFVLVPAYGLVGAASARVLRDLLAIGALGVLAYLTSRRIFAPGAWLAARVPPLAALIRHRLPHVVNRIARRFARIPNADHIELIGSANQPRTFRPGISDIDLLVAVSGSTSRAANIMRECTQIGPKAPLTGAVTLQVFQAKVLGWARHLGVPVFAPHYGRALVGPRIEPKPLPEYQREWRLTYALTLLLRIQRHVLEDSGYQGLTRSDRIAKDFRYLIEQLVEPERSASELLGACPGSVPSDFVALETRRRWLAPQETAEVLRAAHHLVRQRCAELAPEWEQQTGPAPWRQDAWLKPVVERTAPRVDRLLRHLEPAALQLTATEVMADNPMLVLVADDWTEETWLTWVRVASEDGPLKLPFRAYRWPYVLPSAAMSVDAAIEHSMLFHLARAHASWDLGGTSPGGRIPPPEYVRRAAIRETIVALLRIPSDAAYLGAERLWRPSSLAEPRQAFEHWRFRVRAFLGGRLAALSLLLDEGYVPPHPEELTQRYISAYGDSLASWMARRPEEVSGQRAAEILCQWADQRIAVLDDILPPLEELLEAGLGGPEARAEVDARVYTRRPLNERG